MARVLLLHTGGTLGMRGTPLEPDAYASALTESVPELSELAQLDTRIICNLDSSDVGPGHWALLAENIAEARDDYDGFVIVHGTDTMAYTASALSFALKGLDRPVIMTGAQRPLVALRSDARRNLADAVELATCELGEVGICFDGLLLRGCRTTKSNAHDYRAFESPGCEPLARLGVDIKWSSHLRAPTGPFECDARFESDVLVVYVTPGMHPRMLEGLLHLEGSVKGVVLAAYGVGTVPTEPFSLASVVGKVVDQGVEVLVVTQSAGRVDLEMYRNSRSLAAVGAISGGRMRIEAAVAKLMHALAVYPGREERRSYLQTNVAGELD